MRNYRGERLITVAMRRPPGPGGPAMPDPRFPLRCQAIIDSLPIPSPFSLEAFRAVLEDQRRRPLILAAATMPPGCTGLWVSTERADYIFFEQEPAPDQQLHIVLHEIGHMVLGHQGVSDTSRAIAVLFPHLDPDMVTASLAQTVSSAVYSELEEREADIFAALFLEITQDSP
jgi:hypothetical protein